MKFNIKLGASAVVGAVCFIISYVAFHDGEAGLGWLFFLGGLAVVVLGLILSSDKQE
jgi:VIT1/CCC1 family predicted Fe2+/Mn2+ transporter